MTEQRTEGSRNGGEIYEVRFDEESILFDERSAAVDAAKELSEQRRYPVRVVGAGGKEQLTYRDGSLFDYYYETRRQPPRKDRPRWG